LALEVRLSNVTKIFGKVKALDSVSLEFPKGKITVVLGPSGSGKTTMLKIISGLIMPDHGSVFIGDREVTKDPPWEREVSMVFQHPALFPHMTGLENICLPLRKCDKKRVMEIAEKLDILHVLNKKPEEMSGGEQQRVAIARALITEPSVLLLDEPFAHLDVIIKERLMEDLLKVFKELDITVIHVTHDQDEALTLADDLAILIGGRIIENGPAEEVYMKPRTSLGAKFLRHNFLTIEGIQYRFPPEAVEISPDGIFSGIVIACLKKRGYWLLKFRVDETDEVIECAYSRKIAIGEKIRFNIKESLMTEVFKI